MSSFSKQGEYRSSLSARWAARSTDAAWSSHRVSRAFTDP
jgi:hypothetical protein